MANRTIYDNMVATLSNLNSKWRNKETPGGKAVGIAHPCVHQVKSCSSIVHSCSVAAFPVHPELGIALQSSGPLLSKCHPWSPFVPGVVFMDFELAMGFTGRKLYLLCKSLLCSSCWFFARNVAGHAALAGGKQKFWWNSSNLGKFRDVHAKLGRKQKGKRCFHGF